MTSPSTVPLSSFYARNLVALAILMLLQAACGDSSTGPSTTTGTTSTTTTTGGGGGSTTATATFSVTNTPCVAPSAGNVSCTFNASATGATAPYTFAWRFTNPANNQVEMLTGQTASPPLGCGFSTGVVTFTINVSLTATPTAGTAGTVTGTQSITRAAGACGT